MKDKQLALEKLNRARKAIDDMPFYKKWWTNLRIKLYFLWN